MRKTLCCFFLLTTFISYSCGNYFFALNKDGELVMLGNSWQIPFAKNFNLKKHSERLLKLESELKKTKNYMLLSDYALVLMKLGKSKEALELLKVLYKNYPGEYKIASNLGTAYELNGDVENALNYIRIGLKLNPHDHEGSEWIHAKILETKLAIKKDPSWLKTHSVLELSAAQKKDTTVWKHLNIQLQERVPFTPAPDELVADLFVDLGDMTANVGTIHYAHVYYNIAKKYYGSTDLSIDDKIKKMDALLKKYEHVKPDGKVMMKDHPVEGMASKIGKLRYQDILINNNKDNFVPDWSKLNLNVLSLLAMVDFTKTAEQVRDSIEANTNTASDFTLIKDDHDSVIKTEKADTSKRFSLGEGEAEEKLETSYIWIYISISILLVTLIAVILLGRRKK